MAGIEAKPSLSKSPGLLLALPDCNVVEGYYSLPAIRQKELTIACAMLILWTYCIGKKLEQNV